MFPIIGVPCLVLAYHRQMWFYVAGALVAWGVLTWAGVLILRAMTPASLDEAIRPILMLQVGAAAAGFISALPLRLAGFRLARG
jgi:uncharacterized membrane-anchored protein